MKIDEHHVDYYKIEAYECPKPYCGLVICQQKEESPQHLRQRFIDHVNSPETPPFRKGLVFLNPQDEDFFVLLGNNELHTTYRVGLAHTYEQAACMFDPEFTEDHGCRTLGVNKNSKNIQKGLQEGSLRILTPSEFRWFKRGLERLSHELPRWKEVFSQAGLLRTPRSTSIQLLRINERVENLISA
jgi:hypothetical protein